MDVLAMIMPMLALLQASGDVTMIGVGIAAGTAVIGPGAGMGYLIGQTIASIHRQPEAFDQTRTLMFLGMARGGIRALRHSVRPPHSLRALGS